MHSVFSLTLSLNRSQWFLPTMLLNFGSTADFLYDKLELGGGGGNDIPFIDFFELTERELRGDGSAQFCTCLSITCLTLFYRLFPTNCHSRPHATQHCLLGEHY